MNRTNDPMPLQCVWVEKFLYIVQTRQISLKKSLWMVSTEVFLGFCYFWSSKGNIKYYVFKKKQKTTSHLVQL